VLLAVAALRLWFVCLPPLYTTDLLRNIGFGEAFWQWGFKIYSITAFDLSPAPAQFLWPTHHYTYPAVTLLFFSSLAAVHNSIFFGKIILTLIDAANAWLIGRVSQDRWLGLLYWLNPVSIWYTSREGQFEAWVIFWMLIALLGVQKKKAWAYGALGVAVQTKLFPVFLIPWFVFKMSWKNTNQLMNEIAWGALSLVPSICAIVFGTYLSRYFDPGYMPFYNPLTWNIANPKWFPHFPYWLIVAHFIAGVIFLCVCFYYACKRGYWLQAAAPFLFVSAVKTSVIGQFWYMMLVPVFCLTIEDRTWRRIFFGLCIVLGIRSLVSIFTGPIGYSNPPDAQYIIARSFWGY